MWGIPLQVTGAVYFLEGKKQLLPSFRIVFLNYHIWFCNEDLCYAQNLNICYFIKQPESLPSCD